MHEELVCNRSDSFSDTGKCLCLYSCGGAVPIPSVVWQLTSSLQDNLLFVLCVCSICRERTGCVWYRYTLLPTERAVIVTSALNKCQYGLKHAVCELPAGLWADIVLAVTESHLPVLPLPLEGGEGEERGEGLCCDTQWATAKPKCDIQYVHVLARIIGISKVFHTFSGSRVLVMVYAFGDCLFVALNWGWNSAYRGPYRLRQRPIEWRSGRWAPALIARRTGREGHWVTRWLSG